MYSLILNIELLVYVKYVSLTVVPIISQTGTLVHRITLFILFRSGFFHPSCPHHSFCLRNNITPLKNKG